MTTDAPNLDYVDHPTLGRLSFPKSMPPDERNASIVRMMSQRSTGLSPEARQLSPAGADYFRRQQPGVESPDAQGEPTTPEDRAKNSAYDKLPISTKAKLLFMPGAMDEWSKQFYGGQLDPHGATSAIGSVLTPTMGQMSEGTADVMEGDFAKGGHKIIKSASLMALPLMTKGALAAPITTMRAVAGGYVGSKVAGMGAQVAGANPDQVALSEDVGGIVGGGAAATGLARAVLGSPTKALVGRATENPVVSSLLPSKLLKLLQMAGKPSPVAAEIPTLSTTAREVRGPFQPAADTTITPSGNIDLPPESPGGLVRTVKPAPFSSTATATVRPAQITADNLLQQLRSRAADVHGNKPAVFDVTPPADTEVIDPTGFNDATKTYVRPSKMGTQQGIEDMLAAAKAGEPVANRVDLHKLAKTAIGEAVTSGEPGYGKSATFQPQPFSKQYPPPESPQPVSLSELRAAQSPEPPRSSLSKNQRQLAKYQASRASQNSPSDVAAFQEQAAQELFGKSFNDLPVNDPASRLRATMRAIELQVQARRAK